MTLSLCDVYIFRLHFSCYGMRSIMLQINEYDDDGIAHHNTVASLF